MDIYDVISDKGYIRVITANSISATTEGTVISSFKVPTGWKAVVVDIAGSNDSVVIDILADQQSLGAKYGLPIYMSALPTNQTPRKVLIPLRTASDISIIARGIGGTQTLNNIFITVAFIKEGE